MIASRAIARSATAAASRRQMSSQPKMHMAKDRWADLTKTRPPKDHLDEHLVFHPPYNGVTVGLGIVAAWFLGYGVVYAGMRHQQYKQGFWK